MKPHAFVFFLFVNFLSFSLKARDYNPWGVSSETVNSPMFIEPNEEEFFRFNQSVQGQSGAYIGVGIFRVLYALGQGNYSNGFFVDYLEETTTFCKVLLKMIDDSPTRIDWLSNLLLDPSLAELLAEKEVALSSVEFQKFIKVRFEKNFVENKHQLFQRFAAENISAPSFERIASYYYSFVMQLIVFYSPKVNSASGGSTRRLEPRVSFLGSNEAFNRIRRLLVTGKIQVLNINLFENRAMSELIDRLNEFNIPVSTLDLSNAIEYVQLSSNKLIKFAETLRRIRFSKGGSVLLTSREYPYKPKIASRDMWSYLETSPTKLAEIIESGFFDLFRIQPKLLDLVSVYRTNKLKSCNRISSSF